MSAPLQDRPVRPPLHNLVEGLLAAVLLGAALGLAWLMRLRYGVPMQHDSAVFMYCGWLVQEAGFIPYRDIFDINMPLTFLFHAWVGALLGWSDTAMQTANLVLLGVAMGALGYALRGFGLLAAAGSALLFGYAYLGFIAAMFQRDFILLAPLFLGLAVLSLPPRVPAFARGVAAGFLLGVAAGFKPQVLVALPLFYGYLVLDAGQRPTWRGARDLAGAFALGGAGVALPVFGWLTWHGALDDFLDLTRNYLPLFGSLRAGRTPIWGEARTAYLWNQWQSFGHVHAIWFAGAAAGCCAALANGERPPRVRRMAGLLGLLALALTLYPVASGHFFSYHWLPFLACLTALTGLGLARPAAALLPASRIALVAVVALAALLGTGAADGFARHYEAARTNPNQRAEFLAQWLGERLEPGDRVQPLDWVWGGTLHALLDTRTPLATPYLYYAYLQHHVDTAYVQHHRARLVRLLREDPPRFIVDIRRSPPLIHGPRTTQQHPALETLLDAQYAKALSRNWVTIYERRARTR